MSERPPQRPEGALIETAQRSLRIQVKDAAQAAGISLSHWRQIVTGCQAIKGGYKSVRAPDGTLAKMANAVGVTPEELESAGRAGAASALRAIKDGLTRPPGPPSAATPTASDIPPPPDEVVFSHPVELEIWRQHATTPAERADYIATVRVRRVATELRQENRQLRAEVRELRAQLEQLQHQNESTSAIATPRGSQ
ncbi:hypothetical protein [Streptomyces sp. NBRC 109706]|uniref:hypothetical protein n=1 Tax=Streptomyces sp. NBRC 109706 TaxID=1550035 RepID=UPI000A58A163|nr:hypothetical protein [Streptomyces sp. NBRC 109706]